MGIDTEEQRTVDALFAAISANGLRDGEHMRLVKAMREGRPAMPGSTEGDALFGNFRIRDIRVIR